MVAKASPGIRFNEHMGGDGPTVFAHACKLGLEGIVSKRRGSAYRSPSGKTWAGRGARPRWLVAALKRGKKLEHFLIAKRRRAKDARTSNRRMPIFVLVEVYPDQPMSLLGHNRTFGKHPISGHRPTRRACPLGAKSRHWPDDEHRQSNSARQRPKRTPAPARGARGTNNLGRRWLG
jgi:hypothetical protein